MSMTINGNKPSNPIRHISPYTKRTTLNKVANKIVEYMKNNYGMRDFKLAYNAIVTYRVIATHNQGEFKRYPPKGKPGCLEELLKLAVGKKLGTVIR